MAFFDDIGKKLSQAGQTAVQKTKDLTDITRLNGVISEEEKKTTGTYYQIGKLYVAKHSDDYEPDFAEMISVIKASEEKIAQCRQQIQDIKGVIRCEKCGAEIAGNVAFCSSCGAAVPKKAPVINENMTQCSACGQMIAKGMKFCTACGNPMTEAAPAVAEQDAASPIVPEQAGDASPVTEQISPGQNIVSQPEENNNTKRCPNCNVEVSDGISFCTECGIRLN